MEGAEPSNISNTSFKGIGEDGEEKEEDYLEEEELEGTQVLPAPVGKPKSTGGKTLGQYNKPVSHQSETSLLAIMKQMTQIMANIQEELPSEA
ncbi:hypothetical protein O181_059454 [Austropuccinia psidii MF-1]|uniref:Uncharacterized protein n=1 Tax=Austropuccinia psidii MF-1 TaxID=1389203 RepID=A0A9Q3EEE1_9BASI|nr:hypothetical protein [Austropuccinia psidii MF-1]